MKRQITTVFSIALLFAMLLAGCNGTSAQNTPADGAASQQPVSDETADIEEPGEDFSALEHNTGGEGASTI